MIELINVSKNFADKKLIYQISFEIKKGEITTLIGPNGAGKTTLAKLILGLEKPSSGEIIFTQKVKVGYMPQKINFNSNLPLSSNMFLKLLVKDKLQDKELLDFAGFDEIKDKDIKLLSGGQLQKLMFIANILRGSEFLVLDEPTKSLDIKSQQDFYKLIERVTKEHNLTVFMISHDLFTVIKSSDLVLCLNGHICCSGRPNNSIEEYKAFNATLANIGLYNHHHDHTH